MGGVHLPLTRLLMFASVLLFAWCAARTLAFWFEPWQAALGAAFTALAIETGLGTIVPISDPGFCALLWATAFAIESAGGWSWRRIATVTVLGFATMSYRAAGVALVPALLLYATIHWRVRRRAMIPAAFWSVAGVVAAVTYGPELRALKRLLDPAEIAAQASRLVEHYRLAVLAAELYPVPWNVVNDLYHVVASVLLLTGLVAVARRARGSFVIVLASCYLAVLAVVQVADGRYLWPLFPVLAAALPAGAIALVRRLTSGMPVSWARPAVMGVFIAILGGATLVAMSRSAPASLVAEPQTRELFRWVASAGAREPMRVVFHNNRVLTLETRVPAMALLPRSAPGQLAAWSKYGITHFVWQTGPEVRCLQRIANSLVTLYPGRFTLEYENARYRVYRVGAGPVPATTEWERIDWRRADRWCDQAAAVSRENSSSRSRRRHGLRDVLPPAVAIDIGSDPAGQ
jgi:hypothetical protein